MAGREKNWYLADLRSARTTVQSEIDGLLGDGTTLEAKIVTQVADHGGWVCTEADTWVTDLKATCKPALTAFNDALDDLDAEIDEQDDEPYVDEGDWRGLAWKNSH